MFPANSFQKASNFFIFLVPHSYVILPNWRSSSILSLIVRLDFLDLPFLPLTSRSSCTLRHVRVYFTHGCRERNNVEEDGDDPSHAASRQIAAASDVNVRLPTSRPAPLLSSFSSSSSVKTFHYSRRTRKLETIVSRLKTTGCALKCHRHWSSMRTDEESFSFD